MNTKRLVWLKLALALINLPPATALAQIPYHGGIYTQDFNGLDSGRIYFSYTNFPPGWTINATYSPGTYVWTPVTNGYSNNYGRYCFSLAADDPDKAIGLVIGTTGAAYLAARFRNNTGVTLTEFTLSYFVEQWRKGAISGNDQNIPFSYGLGPTNLTTAGTFVNVPALDMHSIHDGDGVAAAMNGNDPANRQLISATVSGIAWLPNQDLWIRWSGVGYNFFSAHALAIDDLSFRTIPELNMSPAGSQGGPAALRFSWSTNFPGYTLQSAATPAAVASEWETVTNLPVTTGGDFGIELEIPATGDTHRFFRLERHWTTSRTTPQVAPTNLTNSHESFISPERCANGKG